MIRNNTTTARVRAGAFVLPAMLLMACVSAVPMTAGATEETLASARRGASIEGVWDSTVTLQVCGAGIDIRKFRALNMFEHNGALVATSEIAPPPSLGKWQWLGERKFRAQFRFQRFGAGGVFEGVTQVTREIEMAKGGNAFTGIVTTKFFDVFDNPIAEGCGKEVATRVF